MKKQLLAVLGILFFSCAAVAQPAPVSAELNPIYHAALKASKTLPQEYSFADLYQAVEKILEANAQSVLESTAQVLEKQNPFLQGTEEMAITRLSESLMARSSYTRMQKRNKELLKAFERAGKILEKDGLVFNPTNGKHMFLVQQELHKLREEVKQAKEQQTKERLLMWMKGLQNITNYGIKY